MALYIRWYTVYPLCRIFKYTLQLHYSKANGWLIYNTYFERYINRHVQLTCISVAWFVPQRTFTVYCMWKCISHVLVNKLYIPHTEQHIYIDLQGNTVYSPIYIQAWFTSSRVWYDSHLSRYDMTHILGAERRNTFSPHLHTLCQSQLHPQGTGGNWGCESCWGNIDKWLWTCPYSLIDTVVWSMQKHSLSPSPKARHTDRQSDRQHRGPPAMGDAGTQAVMTALWWVQHACTRPSGWWGAGEREGKRERRNEGAWEKEGGGSVGEEYGEQGRDGVFLFTQSKYCCWAILWLYNQIWKLYYSHNCDL